MYNYTVKGMTVNYTINRMYLFTYTLIYLCYNHNNKGLGYFLHSKKSNRSV